MRFDLFMPPSVLWLLLFLLFLLYHALSFLSTCLNKFYQQSHALQAPHTHTTGEEIFPQQPLTMMLYRLYEILWHSKVCTE